MSRSNLCCLVKRVYVKRHDLSIFLPFPFLFDLSFSSLSILHYVEFTIPFHDDKGFSSVIHSFARL